MLSKVSNRELYVPTPSVSDFVKSKYDNKGWKYANAMCIELMKYGVKPTNKLLKRIALHSESDAKKICSDILKMYTIGELNPPLFSGWESRTFFSFNEVVIQILGYIFQINGNDLADPEYMSSLKDNIDFKKMKKLKLASEEDTNTRFLNLVNSKVALDKKNRSDLVNLAKTYALSAPQYIKSDEARIAVLMGLVDTMGLGSALSHLKCSSQDVLRYAAAKRDFDGVKLPADVQYGNLKWSERVTLINYLGRKELPDLCEDMSNNRSAWTRFFRHVHMFSQKDFESRFPYVVSSAFLSVGSKINSASPRVAAVLKKNRGVFDVTDTGNLAFRSFASRVQSAVDNKDFKALKSEVEKKPNYLLRNIGSLSNVCTKKTEGDFVELVRENIKHASISVLLSLVQIDVRSKYRIIDSKGNTTVTEANYNPVIGEIQRVAEREIYNRHGFPGKVKVEDKLKNKIVPFLSTNADLDRGSRIKFEVTNYLYFFMHWVQNSRRTDLDHSYIAIKEDWSTEVIYFGNQANNYIAQSGDITDAPAPNGGTEYGRIDLSNIPNSVRYIVPIINVYSGDAFSDNKEAYAGFMFSDNARFSITSKHTRYDLTQPAQSNIPFVIDVKEREVIVVDFNNRLSNGLTAHSSIGEIKKVISALKTKKFMTVERFADMLSGDSSEVSLEIKGITDRDANKVSVNDLQTLVG